MATKTTCWTKCRSNFRRHGVPVETNNVHLVKGLFQETLRVDRPVALAHIDGDWFESVMTCLQRIEPHLTEDGIFVIDDYDDWSGCRKAVDHIFSDKHDRYEFIRKARLHIVRKPAAMTGDVAPIALDTCACSSRTACL